MKLFPVQTEKQNSIVHLPDHWVAIVSQPCRGVILSLKNTECGLRVNINTLKSTTRVCNFIPKTDGNDFPHSTD